MDRPESLIRTDILQKTLFRSTYDKNTVGLLRSRNTPSHSLRSYGNQVEKRNERR